MPEFGFPMPSIQGEPSWDYALRCEAGIEAADWLCERGYWNNADGFDSIWWANRYHLTHARWGNKPIILGEYGSSDPDLDPMEKARQYAVYLRELPDAVQSAHAFIMSANGASDWDAKGFGVTAEMAEIMLQGTIGQPDPQNPPENDPGGSTMDEATRNQIWTDWLLYPAFIKFRADHPELGDALSAERAYGIWTVQHFGGGVAFCKTGDWGNIQIATSKEQLPGPL